LDELGGSHRLDAPRRHGKVFVNHSALSLGARHGAVVPFSFVLLVPFVAKLVVPSPKKYSHNKTESGTEKGQPRMARPVIRRKGTKEEDAKEGIEPQMDTDAHR
jgi:hypothetical protein